MIITCSLVIDGNSATTPLALEGIHARNFHQLKAHHLGKNLSSAKPYFGLTRMGLRCDKLRVPCRKRSRIRPFLLSLSALRCSRLPHVRAAVADRVRHPSRKRVRHPARRIPPRARPRTRPRKAHHPHPARRVRRARRARRRHLQAPPRPPRFRRFR